jgi:transposase
VGKHKQTERQAAYDLYMASQLTFEDVAKIVGVTPTQVGKWAKAENWLDLKKARQGNAESLIAQYYEQIHQILNQARTDKRICTPQEVDQIAKFSKSIDSLDRKLNVGTYYAILDEFTRYIMTNDTAAAKLLAPLVMDFLKMKITQLTS